MKPRGLFLLSPFRFPAQNALYLSNEDVEAFLNAYAGLWHPALLREAAGPPQVASPYDHEMPESGRVFALPDTPPAILPDDWDHRVREGGVTFRGVTDRAATFANLADAVRGGVEDPQNLTLLDLPPERVAPFLGIGFGFWVIETLFEAMEHENLLAKAELWQDVQNAVAALNDPDPNAFRAGLQAAAEKLQAAREVLYPVAIQLLDLCILDEKRLSASLPAAFEKGTPFTLITPARLLEELNAEKPDVLALLRERYLADALEVCGGSYVEREDALLSLDSQLWNLLRGREVYRELLGQEVRVYARRRFSAHPQLPQFLQAVGLTRAVLLAFDDAVLPSFHATVINWAAPDGKQVEAFTRTPHAADNPQTGFHVAHYLHRTIMQDHAATFALLHHTGTAGAWYGDWLELSRFGPVLGQWTTLSRYFNEVYAGEYTSPLSPDDFHGDYLTERASTPADGSPPRTTAPVAAFGQHARLRRRIDAAWTLTALHRGLTGQSLDGIEPALANVENGLESDAPAVRDEQSEPMQELQRLQDRVAGALAERLQARAEVNKPGFLLLNPCNFTRRVALEVPGWQGVLKVENPLKAFQLDGTLARMIVEIPSLGFAWVPRQGVSGAAPSPGKMKLADPRCVRNEFFEAEIDPATGGLRGIRDHKTRVNRIAQQLVFNPGSTMQVREIKTTSTGPALGEIVAEGVLLDEQQEVLAHFRQRYRAWLGRPLLEMRIEILPERKPEGYPWHAYYGARFAWRDERMVLLRGCNGTGFVTTQTRPETPEYLDLRLGRYGTTIFPGGLPFHQRHGPRMVDVILLTENETTQAFDLGIGIDREYPAQTALGLVSPTPLVTTEKGPPHIGTSGWLFHLDAPQLLLTGLRPAPEGAHGVVLRLLECSGQGGHAELRCVRDPVRAVLTDARGDMLYEAHCQGDTVVLEISPNELTHLRVEFA